MHIAEDGDGGVDLGQFFNDENRRSEGRAGASMIRVRLDAHELQRGGAALVYANSSVVTSRCSPELSSDGKN